MLTKEELSEYQKVVEICDKLKWRINRKRKKLEGVKSPKKLEGVQTPKSDFSNIFSEIDDLETELHRNEEMRDFTYEKIRKEIEKVAGSENRDILKHRYLHNKTWQEIGYELGWCEKTVRRKHENLFSHVLIVQP